MLNRFSFEIKTLNDANNAIQNGVYLSLFSVVITILFTTLSIYGYMNLGFNQYSFIDAIVMLFIAFSIWRKLKYSAIVALIYYLTNQVLLWIDGISEPGFMVLVFFLIYYQATLGLFFYHQNKENENPTIT